MLPRSVSADYREKGIHPSDDEMEKLLSSEKYPIILYLHGNSFDRTIGHRVELYNVLNKLNCQVVAFDYRGYGDSDGNPSEGGLVNDSRLVYDYVRRHSANNTLIVWGHSMGTGFPLRWMSEEMVQKYIMSPLRRVGLDMNSDKRIANITCPILILHAENDHVIPVRLGRKLKDAAVAASRDVKYVEFEEARNYKHKFIYLAPELSSLIPSVISSVGQSDLTSVIHMDDLCSLVTGLSKSSLILIIQRIYRLYKAGKESEEFLIYIASSISHR
ncbi:hypothetical protein NECAME_02280 [Necator americanus]|uniref:Serine aminopeptidase S33 domain-containing protein n=1 Tax=Necator americanus TaxID=51031 RepID=W2TI88_NECAM|nr:hypothetical protein NECAME_02280 [Necator americanus]ETN80881.1 hypothetical protein NECAME_02280 [Necator americanus]